MYTWPSTLPQEPAVAGYTGSERDDIARSAEGYGLSEIRDRTNYVVRPTTMSMVLTTAEATTLDDFYTQTLKEVRRFDWDDHRTGNTVTYRFMSPPLFRPYGTTNWTASLQLEMLGTATTNLVPVYTLAVSGGLLLWNNQMYSQERLRSVFNTGLRRNQQRY
jgi:hypothetical protein